MIERAIERQRERARERERERERERDRVLHDGGSKASQAGWSLRITIYSAMLPDRDSRGPHQVGTGREEIGLRMTIWVRDCRGWVLNPRRPPFGARRLAP
jgi:hypothetical protein